METVQDPDKTNAAGQTMLQQAAYAGDVEWIKELLRAGSAINRGDQQDVTALHLAAAGGHMEATRVLLEYGANPNLRDFWGETPLHRAARMNYSGVVRLLVQNAQMPADTTIANVDKKTPRQLADDALAGGASAMLLLFE